MDPETLPPSLETLLLQLGQANGALVGAGEIIAGRARQLKQQFEAERSQRIELRRNGGLAVPICKLNVLVRVRGGRPRFEWRRTTHRRAGKVFMAACPPSRLNSYTNELDHELVMNLEHELRRLRTLSSSLGLMNRRIASFLRSAVPMARSMAEKDERDHLPVDPILPPPKVGGRSATRQRSGQTFNTLIPPTQFPAVRSDD